MLIIAGLALLFLSWVIAPFLPKEGSTPVIHNNIHIINNPVNTSTYGALSQEEPKQRNASEEGLFGRDRIRF